MKLAAQRSLAVLPALLLLLPLTACEEPSPEERVAEIRARYKAEINGFLIHEEPLSPVGELLESEEADEEAEAATGEPEPQPEGEAGEEEMEPVEVRKDAVLDIEVRHDSREKLPGITVDVTMADTQGNEKATWKVWVDTSRIERGPGAQITHTLEDVPYEEGDGFHAEVRYPIPPEERSEYREFAQAAP